MKFKRISKDSLKYFFASAFLTLLFISFCAAFIIAERNTAATGLFNVSTVLSLEPCEQGAVLTINDREFNISLTAFYDMLKSRSLYACLAIFLML